MSCQSSLALIGAANEKSSFEVKKKTLHTDLVLLLCTVVDNTEFLDNHVKWKKIGWKKQSITILIFSPWSISFMLVRRHI